MRFDRETKREVWLALRADGALPTSPTAGTAADPYDASSPTLFVERMRSFQDNTTIHLGPGVFQVPAYSPEGRSWHPKSGQRILGAGMFITTLKVVGATNHDYLNMAIRNDPFVQIEGYSDPESGPFLKSFEVADLTVDCSMREHIGKQVAIGAIHLTGRHIRIRRVRAIDFGTEGVPECFVLGTAGAHVFLPEVYDCGIEDCVIERPSPNSRYTHSCFGLLGDDRAFHRACGIRRCLVNHEYADRPVAIASISFSGTTATALTKTPHGRSTGEWVVVTGALVENPQSGLPPDYNPFNGSYQIKSVVDERRFQYGTMPIVPVAEPTGDMWLGRSLSQIIGIKATPSALDPFNPTPPNQQGVSVTSLGGGQWEVTVITEKPHWQVPGHNVFLQNVTVGFAPSPVLNDLFRITEVVNPTKLKFIVTTDPGNPDSDQLLQAFIGRFGSNAIGVDGGLGAIAENNRVFDARFANYHDSFDSRDLVIRREYYHGAVAGIYQALQGGTQRLGSWLTSERTTAVFSSREPHGLSTGQTVQIRGAVVNGSYSNPFNGSYQITKLDDRTFQYTMQADPGVNAAGWPVFSTVAPLTGTLVRDATDHQKAVFTSTAPHGLSVGEWVSVFGAAVPVPPDNQSILNPFNGLFQVASISGSPPNVFTYQMAGDPGADASGTPSFGTAIGSPLVSSGTVATFRTPLPHRLEAGDGIMISGAADPLYNGGFSIKSVPSPTSFTYEMNGIPSGSSFGAQLVSRWQVRTMLAYRNTIDLRDLREVSMTYDAAPIGIGMAGNVAVPPYTFGQVVLRDNLIRKVDASTDTTENIAGIALYSCDQAIVSGNVMDLTRADQVPQFSCAGVSYFGNQYQTGLPALGYLFYTRDPPTGQFVNEVVTDAALAALRAT